MRTSRQVRVLGMTVALLASVLSVATVTTTATADDSPDRQYPFVCTTARHGLGQPKVDNHDELGIPVAEEDENGDYPQDGRGYPTEDATIIGWSRDCEIDPVFEYWYRTTGGGFGPFEDPTTIPDTLPADIATTTTTDGHTVPYIVRWERGTVNRFIYSVAMLAPTSETDPTAPDDSLWNGRVVYRLDGGVAIGHTQGRLSTSGSLYHDGLSLGSAVLYSSGTRTNTHYNMKLGGETAVMTKAHFVATHGEPLYTVGVGGSGGAIQQYLYAQNHPGLLDGGVPQYSYPDMVTQTVHVGDCELLEHYFEVTDGDNDRWRDVDERQLIHGLNAEKTPLGLSSGDIDQWNLLYGFYPTAGATPPDRAPGAPTVGLTECRAAWFGLTPLVNNPTFTDVDDIDKLAEGTDGIEWTHWADGADVYGIGPDGFARVPWDNVGVQYGLDAVADGNISPAEFLELNAGVGTWKDTADMVETGCPFEFSKCGDAGEFDPWSSRQMRLSDDPSTTPAPRREGDPLAMHGAYENGHVFVGDIDIPMIDWRHYLEEELDMHNSAQSFASRARLEAAGNGDNQVIWWTDARPERDFDQTPMALEVLHDWIMNIKANPADGVGANKPAAAVDSCFEADGSLLFSGDGVWDGQVDDSTPGACTEVMPTFTTSRRVAGGPLSGQMFKCQTKPVWLSILDGDYGDWAPTGDEQERLEAIFPDGVCDYALPDAGDPATDLGFPADVGFIQVTDGSGQTTWRGTVDEGGFRIEWGDDDMIDVVAGAGVIPGPDGLAALTIRTRQVGPEPWAHRVTIEIEDLDTGDITRTKNRGGVVPLNDQTAAGLVPLDDGWIAFVVDNAAKPSFLK